MKKTKLLAALMLVSLCGISDAEAKSHKSEIKNLERHRAQFQAECRESKERLKELSDLRRSRKTDNWIVEQFDDEEIDTEVETRREPVHREKNNPELRKERAAERARIKLAAMEMEKIDRAIRKEKELERLERERKSYSFEPIELI